MSEKLQKVAVINILGEPFDLARNTEHYHLCDETTDAYGRPSAKLLKIGESFALGAGDHQVDIIQALLDLLGDALTRLQQNRDARLGRGEE